jgi:hypothetical protein
MRDAEGLNWVRFHYLPESKRYAENDAETAESMRRLADVGAAVFSVDEECWIVRCESLHAGGSAQRIRNAAEYVALHGSQPFSSAGTYDDFENDERWKIHASLSNWSFERDAPLLGAIADDLADGKQTTLWFSTSSGRVYAPYDGGLDIFAPSANWIASLKAKFQMWLSPEPNGL